jgi:hypothetical protein
MMQLSEECGPLSRIQTLAGVFWTNAIKDQVAARGRGTKNVDSACQFRCFSIPSETRSS